MASVMRSSVLNVVRSCGRSVCAGARARTATAARAVSVAPVARRAMCTAQDFGTLQEVLEREIELEKVRCGGRCGHTGTSVAQHCRSAWLA